MSHGTYLARGLAGVAQARPTGANRVRTLIFDLDDTLYDQHRNRLHQHQRKRIWQFMEERLGVPAAEVHDTWKRGFAARNQTVLGLRSLGFEFTTEAFEDFIRVGYEEHLAPDEPLDQMLRSLPQRRIVMTNGSELHAERALRRMALDGEGLWEGIYGSEFQGEFCKPDFQAFYPVLQAAGARPYECAMFEDNMRNVVAAKQLGMFTVFLAGSGATDEELEEARQHASVDVALRVIHELPQACPQLWHGSR